MGSYSSTKNLLDVAERDYKKFQDGIADGNEDILALNSAACYYFIIRMYRRAARCYQQAAEWYEAKEAGWYHEKDKYPVKPDWINAKEVKAASLFGKAYIAFSMIQHPNDEDKKNVESMRNKVLEYGDPEGLLLTSILIKTRNVHFVTQVY